MHTRRYEPLFQPGRLCATPGALNALRDANEHPLTYIRRHVQGDDGDLHDDDKHANLLAIRRGMRVLSAYVLRNGERIWIITEADRSATTLLLPDEY